MKKILIVVFLTISQFAFSQGITNLILKNNSDWQTLSFRRNNNYVWIPMWDNNGRLFYMPDILPDPKIQDLLCLIDSLTDEGTYIPISENLRFGNNSDKLEFIEQAELAGAFIQINDIGDVVINNSLYDLFYLYPGMYDDVLTKATLIDRYAELLDSGEIWIIPYPPTNTPPYTGCN